MSELDLSQVNMEAFKKTALLPDGHTFYAPDFYKDVGFPNGFLPVGDAVSDDTHKGSIFVDGVRVEKLEGVVNHLTLLHKISRHLGAKGTTKMGRGFQAGELVENIYLRMKELDLTNGETPPPIEDEGGGVPAPEDDPETSEDEHD